MSLIIEGINTSNQAKYVDGALHGSLLLLQGLQRHFSKVLGCDRDEALRQVLTFLNWTGTRELPHHRLSSHLFAAIARKMAAGQRKPPSAGIANDIKAISVYAPYVDAMFVDKECAALLSEYPLKENLNYKAKIFSLNTKSEFLAFLKSLVDKASPEVSAIAAEVYGID